MTRCIPVVSCASAAVLLLAAGQARAVWDASFQVYQAGLTDADHTAADGSQISSIYGLAVDANVLLGHSDRYAAGVPAGQSAWAWHFTGVATNTRLGLFDAAHTQAGDYQFSEIQGYNAGGQAFGRSQRADAGSSAWTWSPSLGNLRIGMTDAVHTRGDGYQSSNPTALNAAGQIVGTSDRFDVPAIAGATAWSWTNTGGTTSIGLTGAGYTRDDGYRFALPTALNDAGRVIGASSKYDGSAYAGTAAWTWTQADGSTRVGLFDADHTSSPAAGGVQVSNAYLVSQSGQVVGVSNRYVGGEEGSSAWSWTPGTGTVRLGLTDAEHTRGNAADGSDTQWSAPAKLNNAGHVIGTSLRYNGEASAGNSAWAWDSAGGTTRIGLFNGAEFTQDTSNTQLSSPTAINEAGRVMGVSSRYDGLNQTGQAAWTWDSANGTTRIGLTTVPYIRSDGYQLNDPIQMNEAGRIVGISERYTGGLGQSVWTWTQASGTLMIGLTDTGTSGVAGHQTTGRPQTSGRHYNEFVAMNEAGQIIGTAHRFSANTLLGSSGWFFDPTTNTSIAIDAFVFDPNASSDGTGLGAARTTPAILTASGIVLGSYDLYTDGTPISHAFVWSLDNAFSDLGQLVDGGLSAQGWDRLANVLAADELEIIAGYDNIVELFSPGSQGVYVLTTIPTPGTAAVLVLGGLVTARRRR